MEERINNSLEGLGFEGYFAGYLCKIKNVFKRRNYRSTEYLCDKYSIMFDSKIKEFKDANPVELNNIVYNNSFVYHEIVSVDIENGSFLNMYIITNKEDEMYFTRAVAIKYMNLLKTILVTMNGDFNKYTFTYGRRKIPMEAVSSISDVYVSCNSRKCIFYAPIYSKYSNIVSKYTKEIRNILRKDKLIKNIETKYINSLNAYVINIITSESDYKDDSEIFDRSVIYAKQLGSILSALKIVDEK